MGPRAARVAHRVLGDGRGDLRACVRDPRRRARPRLSPSRERGGAVPRARASVRVDLDAQRDAPFHRREDVEVARQCDHAARGDRRVGAGDAARLLPVRTLAQADRLLAGDDGAGRGARRDAAQCVHTGADRRVRGRLADVCRSVWRTTSTRRAHLRRCTDFASARKLDLLRRGLTIFALGSLGERDPVPAEVLELARRREEARGARDFDTADRLRDELGGAGWEMRDEPGGGFTIVRRQ